MNHRVLFFMTIVLALMALSGITNAQDVYKWTDASGQVHYSQKKPETTEQVQTLDIPLPPPADSSSADVDAEVARLNALSEQMARERKEAEKARQEQAIRALEQKNKALENALLKQKLEQQQPNDDNSDRSITGYPPVYSYPYPYPPYYSPSYPPFYRPGPPRPPHHHRPCQPPGCQQSEPPSKPAPPLAKPNPPFRPPPAGLAPTTPGVFRGR